LHWGNEQTGRGRAGAGRQRRGSHSPSDSRFAARTIRRSMIASRPKHNPGLGETA
jgi:hypothetical protein